MRFSDWRSDVYSSDLYGFLGVAFGAFGAHALRARLSADALAIWHTAVEYQFYHAGALRIVSLWLNQQPAKMLDAAGLCFAVGVVVFSGSLYALALSGIRGLGAITPIGGLLFLAGWLILLWRAAQLGR